MQQFRLDGKHVVITGASSGFGSHFAGVLAEAGARVVLGASRVEKVLDRVEQLKAAGHEAAGAALDVRSAESIKGFFAAAEQAFGPSDVLVNNAGVEAGAKTYMMID